MVPPVTLPRRLLLLAMLATTAGIATGFLGFVHPAFDTLANFRMHLGVGLLLMAVLWTFRCSRVPAIVFALVGFAALFASAPGLRFSDNAGQPLTGERVYRLLAFNLRFDNTDPDAAMAMIRNSGADILALSEISTMWQARIAELAAEYPHRDHCPEWSLIGGVMILSKFPFTTRDPYCHDYAALSLREVEIEGHKVEIGSAHLRWPWPASGPRQVDALKPRLGEIGENALVAGDFNAATWTALISKFAGYGGLEVVRGIGPTWMYKRLPVSLAWYFGLPMDNAMAKGRVKVLSARALPPAGSDHLPVLVDFVVRDTECCAATQ
jgi:endonuclease/exonuclease/phosphatase (EEP) superfamily protein YafD